MNPALTNRTRTCGTLAALLLLLVMLPVLAGGASPLPAPTLAEEAREAIRAGGTWSSRLDPAKGLFDRTDWPNRLPLVAWVIMLQLVGLAAWPLAARLFPFLPDRGWAVSKVLGSLLLSYIFWLHGRLGGTIHPGTARLILLAALALSLPFSLRQCFKKTDPSTRGRSGVFAMLLPELLFWLVFAVFLVIRAGHPDLWHPFFGGEKPMDFAFLNASVKSVVFPPYNPWFAGEYINYYYMGFVTSAFWVRLTGIVPATAYNLLVPTFAAMTALMAGLLGGVAANTLTSFVKNNPRKHAAITALSVCLGAFLAVFAGNLRQLGLFFRECYPWDWFWAASRAIRTPEGAVPPITEFPFFTFLYGDLHAHLMNMPFFLLAILCAAAWIKNRRLLLFAVLALVGGMVHAINAWDYPAVILAGAWAFLLAARGRWPFRALQALLLSALLLAASRLLLLPFHLDMRTGYGAFQAWTGPRTALADHLVIHGIFLMPLLLCLPFSRRAWRGCENKAPALFWAGMAILAAGMVIGVEWIVLEGDIGRMNTVFKFYIQAWLLLSVVTTAGAAILLARLKRRPDAAAAVLGLCGLLWSASLVYAFTATPARWRDRFTPGAPFGLDGHAFMREARYHREAHQYELRHDFEAITWMLENITGTPVIIEAHLPEYTWGNRYSIHTGLPAIIGWAWHQRQQHAGQSHDELERRLRDVRHIYSLTDSAAAHALARRYSAEYLVIGPAEKAQYPAAGLAKFAEPESPFWAPVHHNEQVAIYRIKKEQP